MSKAKIETELKFKLKSLPQHLFTCETFCTNIIQYYLKIEPDTQVKLQTYFEETIDWSTIKEARVRVNYQSFCGGSNCEFLLTLKSDGTLQRNELEITIDMDQYSSLCKMPKLGQIIKDRYLVPIEHLNLKLEIDRYYESLNGLFTAEVEYDPIVYTNQEQLIDDIQKFIGTDIENVTYDKRYKNVNLAVQLLPTTL